MHDRTKRKTSGRGTILTVEAVPGREISDLILVTVVQNVNSKVRIVQRCDVLPGVSHHGQGLVTNGQEYIDSGEYHRLHDFRVSFFIEVVAPRGDQGICVAGSVGGGRGHGGKNYGDDMVYCPAIRVFSKFYQH